MSVVLNIFIKNFPTDYFLLHVSLIMVLAGSTWGKKWPRTVENLNVSNNTVTLGFLDWGKSGHSKE